MKIALTFILGCAVGAALMYFFSGDEKTNRVVYANQNNPEINSPTDTRTSLKEAIKQLPYETNDQKDKTQTKLESDTTSETSESFSLPTAEEELEYLSDFENAYAIFIQESIDYDWANASESAFYEHFGKLPSEVSESIVRFRCHEQHCILELDNVNFNENFAPALGKLSENESWNFGRWHFNPYPKPGVNAQLTIVMERLNKQS